MLACIRFDIKIYFRSIHVKVMVMAHYYSAELCEKRKKNPSIYSKSQSKVSEDQEEPPCLKAKDKTPQKVVFDLHVLLS